MGFLKRRHPEAFDKDNLIVRAISSHPALLAVALNSALIAYWFLPDALYASLCANDEVMHIPILRQMQEQWLRKGGLLDFWSSDMIMGAAVIRYGHWLFYFFAWLVHQFMPHGVPVVQSFYFSVLIFAALLPWSFYLGARWLGFSKLESVLIPALFTMTADSTGYGIGLCNYTRWGHGIVNQGFALLFFPLALGLSHRALRGEGSVIWAAMALAATFMGHLFQGYMAALWIALDAILVCVARPKEWRRIVGTCLRLGMLFCLFASISLYPILQDRLLQHRNVNEPAYKFLGVGAHAIWRDLVSGDFLDYGAPFRLITLFSMIGFFMGLVALIRRPRELDRFNACALPVHVLFVTALSFGPGTWGALSWLPFSKELHWHRFIVAAQMSMVFCAGVGVAGVFDFFHSWLRGRLRIFLVAVCLAGLCVPVLRNRHQHFTVIQKNQVMGIHAAWNKDKAFHEIVAFARAHPEGRYYAGNFQNFGNTVAVGGVKLFDVLTQSGIEVISYLYHCINHAGTIYHHTDWRDPQDPRQEELLGIRYVILPNSIQPQPRYRPVLKTEVATVYDSGQRVGYFMVGTMGPKGCAQGDGLYYSIKPWLLGPLSDNKVFPAVELSANCSGQVLLTDVVKQEYRPEASGVLLGQGVGQGNASRRYWAKVRMDTAGLLVFKMNYHPAWRAFVNGRAMKTMMVIPAYQAVSLEPGTWDVQLEYMPPRTRQMLFVGVLVLSLAFFLARIPLVKKRL